VCEAEARMRRWDSEVLDLVYPRIGSRDLDDLWLLGTFGEACPLAICGVYLWEIV
jgi:hypothetical protein